MEKRCPAVCPVKQSTNLTGDPQYRQTILSGHQQIKPPPSLSFSLSLCLSLSRFLFLPFLLFWFIRFTESNLHRVDLTNSVSVPDTSESAFFMMYPETLDLQHLAAMDRAVDLERASEVIYFAAAKDIRPRHRATNSTIILSPPTARRSFSTFFSIEPVIEMKFKEIRTIVLELSSFPFGGSRAGIIKIKLSRQTTIRKCVIYIRKCFSEKIKKLKLERSPCSRYRQVIYKIPV